MSALESTKDAAAGDDTRETLADGPAPNAEAVRRILAILRGGAR
ncbi:MAG TPA: hypothetical protein VIP58_10310 [Nocardioides sp.]